MTIAAACLPLAGSLLQQQKGQQGLKPAWFAYPSEQKPSSSVFWSPARHQNRYVIAIE